MSDYLQEFIDAANKDNREGDHDAMVSKVEDKTWPSGDQYRRVTVSLLTAGNAKADCNLNPIPGEKELAAIKEEGNRGKMRGVAGNIALVQQLEKHYGKTPATITEGDMVCVKTVKTKVDTSTGKGGFIRIIAFLPRGGAKKDAAAVAADSTPF